MKEYLKRLARGNFTYDIPQLDIDTKRIVKAACNSVIRQSFVLKSDLHTMGIIWSQNDRVVIMCFQVQSVKLTMKSTPKDCCQTIL